MTAGDDPAILFLSGVATFEATEGAEVSEGTPVTVQVPVQPVRLPEQAVGLVSALQAAAVIRSVERALDSGEADLTLREIKEGLVAVGCREGLHSRYTTVVALEQVQEVTPSSCCHHLHSLNVCTGK